MITAKDCGKAVLCKSGSGVYRIILVYERTKHAVIVLDSARYGTESWAPLELSFKDLEDNYVLGVHAQSGSKE
jgi:hypothetical protein